MNSNNSNEVGLNADASIGPCNQFSFTKEGEA